MTSNGYKLDTDIQKWVDAGPDSFNISIDSLEPRMFAAITGHNKLETILRGIDKAIALGDKEATHWLQDGFTGATKHLAMLGG
jgi:cyclic pyranopterin phosphate synthase